MHLKSKTQHFQYNILMSHANMASEILVSTDSGNGFLHDGAKPLSETMWAYHQIDQEGPVPFISVDYHERSEDTNHWIIILSPEISHLFSSVLFVSWWLADSYCHDLESPKPLSTQGQQGILPIVFCDHTTGGQCPKNLKDKPVAWGVSHMKDYDLLC